MRDTRKFKVCAAYDTETCNYGDGADTRAYPILFIVNDFRMIDVKNYVFNESDDIRFYRYSKELYAYFDDLISYGLDHNIIPIVTAYNLMFDLQPLMFDLSQRFELKVTAQTATSAYAVDLCIKGVRVLRFWDTFYLEMGGLRAMGEICGLPKAVGDWDYSLVRTPETVLTETELFYAKRDVQVIPAYLKYVLTANAFLSSDMLGSQVMTKTSIVRQMAKLELGKLKYKKRNGKKMTLGKSFRMTCEQEFPKTFAQYALRKACFRGGLTFTSANYATQIMHNVASLDVTSMHHTFINGRMLPVHFTSVPTGLLEKHVQNVLNTPLDDVLTCYERPFNVAFHAKIRFKNLRLKKNTVFSRCGIGILSEGKFSRHAVNLDIGKDDRNKNAEAGIKKMGWLDTATNAVFAFGKLMQAREAVLCVNEIEVWCIGQVYDFDSFNVVLGEESIKFAVPPDYVSLQSNILFERKQVMKNILKKYVFGEKYTADIPTVIPAGIRDELKNGTADETFLQGYYNSTVKGMFNGIYGTQAMDLMRPDFCVLNGEIMIDPKSKTTSDNFAERRPKKINVLYTYGMRIVGGSRMHLIIALELLHRYFGEKAIPTGGDTDSIKISLDTSITDADLEIALKPIADASDAAINRVQERNRRTWPQFASALDGIGHFDIEKCGDGTRWESHMESWNKARISVSNGKTHVTCAGLSRPRGKYHVENWCNDMLRAGYDFASVAHAILGYNTFVSPDLCFYLQTKRPPVNARFRGVVTDYRGKKASIDARESIALYPNGRWLGETDKMANAQNVKWLEQRGVRVNTAEHWICVNADKISLQMMSETGEFETMMETLKA